MVSAIFLALTWWESMIPKLEKAVIQKGSKSLFRSWVPPWMLGVVWFFPPCSISAIHLRPALHPS